MPFPSASVPQRSQVAGMNCIQPTAPAELGPMFRPKFDSTLLIAASTVHGIPYVEPACCHRLCSCAGSSCCGCAGAENRFSGRPIEPLEFGVEALEGPWGR